MARKRMISPEIWESQDFSSLSDVAKIVFISLFSHADDEGRGRADSAFIKNTTFPYDENRRVADIKQALSEIALHMSVQFYSVNGIEYYFMTSWERWQKIDKPSKSKLPPPPFVGEGGAIHSDEEFGEHSANVRGGLDETSPPNRIEDKVSKKVSNKKEVVNIESYDEIFETTCVGKRLKDALMDFIRHLRMNGIKVINNRLYGMIVNLDMKYGKDELLKCREVRRAIVNGYKRLECEEVNDEQV